MNDTLEKGISSKYIEAEEKLAEHLEKEGIKKSRLKHAVFYFCIALSIILNYLSSACSFEIGCLKFNGFKDWSGSFSLLVLELVFLFIFGARSEITHLNILLDKLSSIVRK